MAKKIQDKNKGPIYPEKGDNNLDYTEANLKTLLRKYPLRKIVKKEKTEYKKLIALSKWVGEQWQHGREMDQWLDPVRRHNAVEILKKAHKGGRFNCLYFATVLATCAVALGYRARRVYIIGHVVAEIWSEDYQKWILFDPDDRVHFEAAGIPLSAFELQQAVRRRKVADITLLQLKPWPHFLEKPPALKVGSKDYESWRMDKRNRSVKRYRNITRYM
ncbi:MAG: transglutaminase domain-containing protein [Lentisphaeria bacterium]|nr:transglutaminase-like domain-containing protein [Lentisphaeria bacterium]NQZ71402.1 transglutaminase domain-containing protein [Lentisphaeria bacterium]